MKEKIDLRIQKTHRALCNTFLEMLREKPFDDITVNELCDRALVRRATFYKHFADKYDFFAFFIREIRDSFNADFPVKEKDLHSLAAYYTNLFEHFLAFLEQQRPIVENVIESRAFSTLFEILSAEIQQEVLFHFKKLQKSGVEFIVPPEIPAAFYTGGIIQTVRTWLTAPDAFSKEELVQNVQKLLESVTLIKNPA